MTLTTREFIAYCLIMFSLPLILGWAINEHDERMGVEVTQTQIGEME